jgi:LacI family transcriptional regulator
MPEVRPGCPVRDDNRNLSRRFRRSAVPSAEQSRRSVTLREVAAAAKVHVATASRALDPDSVHPVAADTKARVHKAAEALGYRSHLVARGLRRGRSSTVGVVVADLANPFTAPILRGLENSLEAAGYMALVAESREDPARLASAVEHLLDRQVDALVLLATRHGDDDRVRAWSAQAPVALIGRTLPCTGLPAVTHDDRQGAELVAGHLAELGHRDVVQLPGPLDVPTFLDRYESFEKSAQQLGLVTRTAGRTVVADFGEAVRLVGRLLSGDGLGPSTAIFAHNDYMAMGAVRALRAAGLDCPGDLSVVGYNDVLMSECLDPPLTTIHIDGDELGRRAGQLALDLVNGARIHGEVVRSPAALVVRASTAPPRA